MKRSLIPKHNPALLKRTPLALALKEGGLELLTAGELALKTPSEREDYLTGFRTILASKRTLLPQIYKLDDRLESLATPFVNSLLASAGHSGIEPEQYGRLLGIYLNMIEQLKGTRYSAPDIIWGSRD